MDMKQYVQKTTKISCTSDKEFVEKFNKLGVSGEMPLIIESTTPEATDVKKWYEVKYWMLLR